MRVANRPGSSHQVPCSPSHGIGDKTYVVPTYLAGGAIDVGAAGRALSAVAYQRRTTLRRLGAGDGGLNVPARPIDARHAALRRPHETRARSFIHSVDAAVGTRALRVRFAVTNGVEMRRDVVTRRADRARHGTAGAHHTRKQNRDRRDRELREAAKAAGIGEYRAARISDYDLRHSRLTHLGQVTSNLSGVMFLAGHKQPATTRPLPATSEAGRGRGSRGGRCSR